MDSKNFDILASKWASDQAFRQAVRANPHQAIADAGVTLGADELAALDSMNVAGLSDAELEDRISKKRTGSYAQC